MRVLRRPAVDRGVELRTLAATDNDMLRSTVLRADGATPAILGAVERSRPSYRPLPTSDRLAIALHPSQAEEERAARLMVIIGDEKTPLPDLVTIVEAEHAPERERLLAAWIAISRLELADSEELRDELGTRLRAVTTLPDGVLPEIERRLREVDATNRTHSVVIERQVVVTQRIEVTVRSPSARSAREIAGSIAAGTEIPEGRWVVKHGDDVIPTIANISNEDWEVDETRQVVSTKVV